MAWHNKIYKERTPSGQQQLCHSRSAVKSCTTSRSSLDEFWSLIRYDILIDDSFQNKLKQKGVKNKTKLDSILLEISAYLEQAENFYRCALASEYRSAPLLYYYSFLNLAKIYVISQKPELAGKKFVHGIKRKKITGNLANNSFYAEPSNRKRVSVFNEAYNLFYDKYLPSNKTISIRNTLGYMSDITHETKCVLKKYTNKLHPARLYVFFNNKTKKCWTVLATEIGFYPASYKSSFGNFESNFQRFMPGPLTQEYVYRLGNQAKEYNYSQSVSEYDFIAAAPTSTQETKRLIDKTLGSFYQDSAYNKDYSLIITDPLRKNWQMPFNEMFAIYSMMFCLSEVVRYTPTEFNTNFSPTTKDGWLIKSFISSAPYTCIVHLASCITGTTYIIENRS